MKTFPLQSLTLNEAQQKQFALVDTISPRHFPGSEFLTGGDLGLTPGLVSTAHYPAGGEAGDAFHAPAAALVQGAGTGAIRAALAALLKPGSVFWCMTRLFTQRHGLLLSRWG